MTAYKDGSAMVEMAKYGLSAFAVCFLAPLMQAETQSNCYDQIITPFGEHFEVRREITTTSKDTRDCTNAIVTTLIYERGHLIHAASVPLHRLTVNREEAEPELIKGFLNRSGHEPFVIPHDDVPDWESLQTGENKHLLNTRISKEHYPLIRVDSADLLCYSIHYEHGECIQFPSEYYFVSFNYGD